MAICKKVLLPCLIFILSCVACRERVLLTNDLVPAVDNIRTFAVDTTALEFTNVFFDSLHTSIKDQKAGNGKPFIPFAYASLHALGVINNDPVFGKTVADMALQFRQQLTALAFPTDNVLLDSLVLQLPFAGTYGDRFKSKPMRFNVYRLTQTLKATDTLFNSSQVEYDANSLLGSVSADLAHIDTQSIDGVVTKALRIPLDTNLARVLISLKDTAEYEDYPTFVKWFKGLYITCADTNSGNIMGTFVIADATMKLYYRVYNSTDTTKQTSTYRYDQNYCSHYNRIRRTLIPNKVSQAINTKNGDEMYLQGDCGASLQLRFPNLTHLKGKVINKAQLQIPVLGSGNALSDEIFGYSGQLRIVGIDSSGKVVPLPFANTLSNQLLTSLSTQTIAGQQVKAYMVNITKTVQALCLDNKDKIAYLRITLDGGLRAAAGRTIVAGPKRPSINSKLFVTFTNI